LILSRNLVKLSGCCLLLQKYLHIYNQFIDGADRLFKQVIRVM